MGCVTATAKNRRRKATKDPRYKYGNRSLAVSQRRLERLVAGEKARASRKGGKKKG